MLALAHANGQSDRLAVSGRSPTPLASCSHDRHQPLPSNDYPVTIYAHVESRNLYLDHLNCGQILVLHANSLEYRQARREKRPNCTSRSTSTHSIASRLSQQSHLTDRATPRPTAQFQPRSSSGFPVTRIGEKHLQYGAT
jgi:hypothetical protein